MRKLWNVLRWPLVFLLVVVLVTWGPTRPVRCPRGCGMRGGHHSRTGRHLCR